MGQVACPVSGFLFFNGPPARVTPVADGDRSFGTKRNLDRRVILPNLARIPWPSLKLISRSGGYDCPTVSERCLVFSVVDDSSRFVHAVFVRSEIIQ